MRVTANYTNPAKSPAVLSAANQTRPSSQSNNTDKTNRNPAFKQVFLTELKMKEIAELYEDGPALAAMIKRIAPAFNEKFGEFFNLYLAVNPDFYRSIQSKISTTGPKIQGLKQFIADNNREIRLPRFILDAWTRNKPIYDEFLYGNKYYPEDIAFVKFGKYGAQETEQKFNNFFQKYDAKKLIRELYEKEPPQIITREDSTYLKHSTNVYGNTAV